MNKPYTIEEIAKMAAARHISYGRMVTMLEGGKITVMPDKPKTRSSPRKVKVMDTQGNVIKVYASTKEAAKAMNVSH